MNKKEIKKLNSEQLLKDFHLFEKIMSLFMVLVLAITTFGLYVGCNKFQEANANIGLHVFLLLAIIVVLTMFVFRDAVRTINTYFDIRDKKYVITDQMVIDKSIYKNENGDIWIKTDADEKKQLRVSRRTYNRVHRGEGLYIVYLNNKILGIYKKKEYRLDYKNVA